MSAPLVNLSLEDFQKLVDSFDLSDPLTCPQCIYNDELKAGAILYRGKPVVALGQVKFEEFYAAHQRFQEVKLEIEKTAARGVLRQLRSFIQNEEKLL